METIHSIYYNNSIIFIDLLYEWIRSIYSYYIILIKNYQNSHIVQHIQTSNKIKIKLAEEVTFIIKMQFIMN